MSKLIYTLLILSLQWPLCLHAAPVISQQLRDAFARQQQRAQANNQDMNAFKNDMKDLADKGDPVAQFYYAVLNDSDNPYTPENLKYLQNSANGGCAGAAGLIAMYYSTKNKGMGKYWLEYAAKNGEANSQFMIAMNYFSGENGYIKDPAASYGWLLLASAQVYSKGLQSQIEMILFNMNGQYSKEQISKGKKIYSEHRKKYEIQPFHICGQMLPGNDRLSESKIKELRAIK